MTIFAAIYLRISDADRDDFDAIKRQYEDSLMLITRMGWTLCADTETTLPEFHGAFVDHSKSASKRSVRRPAYERMIAAIGQGRIHAIIGYDLDRITRQPRQLEDLIDLAEDRGLIVKTLQSDYDLSTEDGRLHARIKATIAKNEVEQKSKRQRRANDQKAVAFIPVPARRPYGFENGGKVPRPDEAAIVQRIFAEVIRGDSLNLIARRLNAEGVPMTTGRSGKWERNAVRLMVLNCRYAGMVATLSSEERRMGDTARRRMRLDPNRWVASPAIEPIITADDFRKAHAIVTAAERITTTGPERRHMLSGVGQCACGAAWKVHNGRGGQSYSCRESTGHPTIFREATDRNVALAVGFCLATRADDVLAALGTGQGVDIASVSTRLAAIDAEVADIMEDRAAGLLTAAQSRPELQRLASARATLEEALAAAHRSNVSTAVLARLAEKYRSEQPQAGEYANETPRAAVIASAARIARDFLSLEVAEMQTVVGTLFKVSALPARDELGKRRTPDERIVIEDRLLAA